MFIIFGQESQPHSKYLKDILKEFEV